MPSKAKYWQHYEVNGDIAICKIQGCKSPRVSVRRAQKPGEDKKPRIGRSYICLNFLYLYREIFNMNDFGILCKPPNDLIQNPKLILAFSVF